MRIRAARRRRFIPWKLRHLRSRSCFRARLNMRAQRTPVRKIARWCTWMACLYAVNHCAVRRRAQGCTGAHTPRIARASVHKRHLPLQPRVVHPAVHELHPHPPQRLSAPLQPVLHQPLRRAQPEAQLAAERHLRIVHRVRDRALSVAHAALRGLERALHRVPAREHQDRALRVQLHERGRQVWQAGQGVVRLRVIPRGPLPRRGLHSAQQTLSPRAPPKTHAEARAGRTATIDERRLA